MKPDLEPIHHARIAVIDALRGLVMVLMLLDHTRSGWNEGSGLDPLDLSSGDSALFFTRWITHFCAPVFVFLTGLSAGLSRQARGSTAKSAGRRLLLRGLSLLALELLFITILWGRVWFSSGMLFQVIGAIGVSMMLLAALQFLPSRLVGILGLAIVALHNLIPNLSFEGPWANLAWGLFHQRETIAFASGWSFEVLYPVLPWLGTMALGWAAAELYRAEARKRQTLLLLASLVSVLTFLLLRSLNGYGDPRPWSEQPSGFLTVLDFLKVEKYPPSLDYLLMTLGPALLFLALLDRWKPHRDHVLLVLGRTPLFFYLVHLPLLMVTLLLADLGLWAVGIEKSFGNLPFQYPLLWTYVVWLALIPLLYLLCHWWTGRPRRRPKSVPSSPR